MTTDGLTPGLHQVGITRYGENVRRGVNAYDVLRPVTSCCRTVGDGDCGQLVRADLPRVGCDTNGRVVSVRAVAQRATCGHRVETRAPLGPWARKLPRRRPTSQGPAVACRRSTAGHAFRGCPHGAWSPCTDLVSRDPLRVAYDARNPNPLVNGSSEMTATGSRDTSAATHHVCPVAGGTPTLCCRKGQVAPPPASGRGNPHKTLPAPCDLPQPPAAGDPQHRTPLLDGRTSADEALARPFLLRLRSTL
jgi:hypothetical protein